MRTGAKIEHRRKLHVRCHCRLAPPCIVTAILAAYRSGSELRRREAVQGGDLDGDERAPNRLDIAAAMRAYSTPAAEMKVVGHVPDR